MAAVDEDMRPPADLSVGELVGRLSEGTSRLVRDEMRLATAEMTQKGKAAGLGAGIFGGAGILVLYGLGVLIAAAVAGLSVVLAVWAAALIIAGILLVAAGLAALVGKRELAEATPPLPTEAVQSTKEDVDEIKRGLHS